MVYYVKGIHSLIKNMIAEFTDITQTWYSDDAGALAMFANFEFNLNFLKQLGPRCGYYPKPYKSVMIMHPENIESGKRFGFCHGFKVCTGVIYLGGFIGNNESKRNWLKERKNK